MVKRFKSSFKARLMTLAILPVLVVAVALTMVVGFRLQKIMSENTIHELQGAAYGLREMIATISPDEFSVDADGVMYAGDKDLTYLNGVFDEFTKESGMYATLFFGDTRRNTSVVNNGQRAVGTQCTDAVKAAVLQKGQEFTSMSTQVAGKECVVAYVPLYQPGTKNVCGMVFTGISKENFKKSINSAISYVLAVAIFATAATIAIAVLVSSKMNAALVGASKVCNDLADGDFTGEKTSAGGSRADELGRMVNSVNEMKERFDTTISGVKNNIDTLVVSAKGLDKAANETSNSMNDLSNAVEEIANGATTQAQEVENSAQGIAEILHTMESINESVKQTNECTAEMDVNSRQVVGDFGTLIQDTLKSIEKLKDITEKMNHVQDAVETVTTAANDINTIASQTNLLSLNASIEAARAGEAGRGFAVVATEISALADQSNQAAVKIREIMSNLKDETEGAVSMVSEMSEMMDKQDETSKKSEASLQELIKAIEKTKAMVGDVKENSDAVQKLCSGLNDNISSLSAISEENAASAEETSASITQMSQVTHDVMDMSKDLKAVADKLEELTAYFKVN